MALSAKFAEVIACEQLAMRIRTTGLSTAELVAYCARLARIVTAAEITLTVTGDPDDDQVLACALAARADAIVSGDKRLRNLKTYQGIPILGSAAALALIARCAAST